MVPENHRRDKLLFGKHMISGDRLNALTSAAKRVLLSAKV